MPNTPRKKKLKFLFFFIAAIVIGTIIFKVQKRSSDNPATNIREAEFDWSQSALIPVKVVETSGGFQFIAGGQTINFTGDQFRLDADQKLNSKCSVSEREFTVYSLQITAPSRSLLKRVSWFAGEWEPGVEQVKQATNVIDNVLFLRKKDVSFFISLDFPYSVINKDGVSYPPNDYIEAGQTYSAHSISIGASRLSGQKVGKFDRNEIEAVSEYVEQRFPQRFERPMFISSSITNRMVDLRDGRIFYSTFDQPTVSLRPELIEKDLELCSKLGIEYYQAFEGVFDWPDKEKSGLSYQRLLKKAKNLNVRMGDYTIPQGLYCAHYNYENRVLNHPEWLMKDSIGKTGALCLAVKEYQKILHDTILDHNRKFTNCEYYFAPNSRLSDTKIFEYSFLQGLAVTPNITLGKLRTYLSRIPKEDADKSMAFISHWLKFIQDNFVVWKRTKRIGDAPGIGASESYAHILNDRGFIILVNQNSFPRTTTFSLNNSIGLSHGDTFSLYERYPHECLIEEQALPFAKRDDSVTCVMPPNSVRIIQISPSQKMNLPAVFGNSSELKKLDEGYRFTLSAAQGKKVKLGIVLQAGQTLDKIAVRQTPTVPMYTFPTSVKVLDQVGNLARIEIQFPRELAPCELINWHVNPGNIDMEFPPSDNKGFLGAIIHNAFSEDYEVQLDVNTKSISGNTGNERLISKTSKPKMKSLSMKGESLTYTTSFLLPFIERYGLDRSPADDVIIELAFSNPEEVSQLKCLLNGKDFTIRQYKNPRRPDYYSFYVELTGNIYPGKVEMVLNVQYMKSK